MQTAIRSNTGLTDAAIRSVAPSIFATEKHASRSARYTYVPTIDVLNGLRKEGFFPVMASQSRARDYSRREFTKHMLRLRRDIGDAVVGKEVPEIVLINSHDGTSAYQMMAGVFRLVCSNGMVVGDAFNELHIHHKGDIVGRVIEGAYEVVEEFGRIEAAKDEMKVVHLDEREQHAFANAALVAKYDANENNAYPITESDVLRARRADDAGNDLWRVFNRVQENLVRGGLASRSASGRRTTTREVRGISQNVQLNRALWTLAENMATLKKAA